MRRGWSPLTRGALPSRVWFPGIWVARDDAGSGAIATAGVADDGPIRKESGEILNEPSDDELPPHVPDENLRLMRTSLFRTRAGVEVQMLSALIVLTIR